MASHELYIETTPKSLVPITLVKIGVVRKPMAFCSTLHAKYHIDAFTGNVILVYNWLIFFKLVFIYFSDSSCDFPYNVNYFFLQLSFIPFKNCYNPINQFQIFHILITNNSNLLTMISSFFPRKAIV